MKEQKNKADERSNKGKVERDTTYMSDDEMQRIAASDDDYRLPRSLPEDNEPEEDDLKTTKEKEMNDDEEADVNPEELRLLEASEMDMSSDESQYHEELEDEDEDGDELNEGPDEGNMFDTGEDLDMPNDVNNPDIDEEDERF